jgi:class 3 adenylate cyclase/YHS domain-containing protein
VSDRTFFATEGGTRVDRTFAFVDLSGFTTYTDTEGDAEAVHVLSGFRAAVRDIAAARAVRIAKWLGDGAMLVAVEPEPAVEAVIDIERRIDDSNSPLALRAGIASGPVILFEGDDYIGSVVNLAKRLCDAAEPHEILVGPGVDAYVPPWGEVHDDGDLLIKGFEGTLVRQSLCLKEMKHPVVDPVCGLPIDPEYASGEAVDDNGEKVVFCSPACEVTFLGAVGGPLF